MLRFSVTFVALLIYSTSIGQLSSAERQQVDEVFKNWSGKDSPGAAQGIVQDGKLIYSRGYGLADLEHNVPITDSTIFYIGSVSKQFVTMGLLLLEEQGKLSLDDRIQKYLPDFPEYGAPLTIRHFIHHTSGVRDNLTLWILSGQDLLDHIDKGEMYQMIRRQKELNFAPGEKYLYSNSCYFLLGLIIETVSGESLRDFGQHQLFGPLGMNHTFFGDDNTRIIKNRAFSYQAVQGGFQNQIMRFDLVGSGGVYSNIRDLYLWDQNFYHNKLGKRSQALIDKMHVEGKLNNGSSSGYAFAIINGKYRGQPTVSHTGALAGYRSHLLRFPTQKTSVIILGNVIPFPIDQLPYRVADIVLKQKLGPVENASSSSTEKASIATPSVPIADPSQFIGSFYSEELDVTYAVTSEGNNLFASIRGRKPMPMKSTGADLFDVQLPGAEIKMHFERDSPGKVTGFSIDAGRVTHISFIKK
ncbi:MAG TPA: serine hydrolase domain-containing protein [Cyclobacteriaceae bacterium]|nr:serine hydrolase domain-containing protein [Cyclobacteriaceae bacterium]